MIQLEVVEGSVSVVERASGPLPERTALGPAELQGEIVDSKCYLGVMNPGHLKPHRACAINCLRGGIPPVLLSRDETGAPVQTVLVSGDERLLRDWILEFVAEPIEVEICDGRTADLPGWQECGFELVPHSSAASPRLPRRSFFSSMMNWS